MTAPMQEEHHEKWARTGGFIQCFVRTITSGRGVSQPAVSDPSAEGRQKSVQDAR
jgi:hypothetical protein